MLFRSVASAFTANGAISHLRGGKVALTNRWHVDALDHINTAARTAASSSPTTWNYELKLLLSGDDGTFTVLTLKLADMPTTP